MRDRADRNEIIPTFSLAIYIEPVIHGLPYVLGPRDHGPSVSSWAGFYPRIERLPLHFHVSTYLCDTASGRRILWAGVSAIAEVVPP
jgi:hypothetical protein